MDEVFGAIDDPSRRRLLDELHERDGQTLTELCTYLPQMTRYGVMNHLRVLEDAGLVTTIRQGRSKLHYLNPVPIRLIHDRWISRFAEHRVGAIAGITTLVERGAPMATPTHVYTSYIRGTAARVWEAITEPAQTSQYFYGTSVESTWEAGSRLDYRYPDGSFAATGEIVAIDPPHRLEHTFHARWDPELEAEGPVREVWTLTEMDGVVQLRVELYDTGTRTLEDFRNGLPYIVAGLKSLVETGEPLPAPA